MESKDVPKMNLEVLTSLVGNEIILSGQGLAKAEQAFKGRKLIGLLFSAHYTPPCRSFVKKYLVPFYKEMNDEFK